MRNDQFFMLFCLLCFSFNAAYAETECRVISKVIKNAEYKGECLNGLANGYGVATDKNIAVTYKGQLKNGKFNGVGTLVASLKDGTNETWHGNWLNGNLTGYATFDSKERSYKGQWKNGQLHGQGTEIYHDSGKKFIGTFSGGYWLKGRLTLSDGTYSQGQWLNKKLSGYVIQTYSNGAMFKGQYRNGDRHGKGIYIPKGGKPLSGVWKNGKAVSGDVMEFLRQPVRTSTNSRANYSIGGDVCRATNGAKIIAQDDKNTFLGTVTSGHRRDSIFNEFGEYGSEFRTNSIWNEFSTFGSEFGMYSPYNEFAMSPPMLIKNGTVIGFLSANKMKTNSITPNLLKALCGKSLY